MVNKLRLNKENGEWGELELLSNTYIRKISRKQFHYQNSRVSGSADERIANIVGKIWALREFGYMTHKGLRGYRWIYVLPYASKEWENLGFGN